MNEQVIEFTVPTGKKCETRDYALKKPCNPHTFRRTFASNLHRSGLDVEHIMRLGGWESLDMVLRYTRSVKFEDSLKLYQKLNSCVG